MFSRIIQEGNHEGGLVKPVSDFVVWLAGGGSIQIEGALCAPPGQGIYAEYWAFYQWFEGCLRVTRLFPSRSVCFVSIQKSYPFPL